jgi:hypothetical protein
VALTLWRWVAIAGLGCLGLAVAYAPPEPHEPGLETRRQLTPERARVERLDRAFGQARDALRDVQFRDSLGRALRGAPASASPVHLVVVGPLPESSRRQVRVALERLWQRLEPAPGARIAVLLDARPRWFRTTYVLPEVLDGRTCVASISRDYSVRWLFEPASGEIGSNLLPWLRDALGPCLYYAAFGRPGPAIKAWLTARAFTPAYTADWEAPPQTLGDLEDLDRASYQQLISGMSFDALACADGDLLRCRRALLEPLGEGRAPPQRVAGFVRYSYWAFNVPGENRFLANLVHEMGRERFARFWGSSAPVDSAFLQAFGQPIDGWTARWAGDIARDLPPFSPAPRPIAVVLGLALAAVAAAAAAVYVTRRQVA